MKISLIVSPLLIAVLCLAQIAHGSPKYGGTVVVAIASDPGGLNPAITTQGGVHLICGSIFSGLVAHDFNLNPVPDLAERWEVSPDGKTYTFHLAAEAVFHDGVPVTSQDVKFTFEQLLMKYHSRTRTSVGNNLEQVSTPDAQTVVFEFKRPYAVFLQLIDASNAPVMPKHLYDGTDPLTNPHNTNPVGSGPFKLQEWLKGDHLMLVKNERYFKAGKPYLDRIVYKVMPTGALATIAFERGEVDYLLGASPLDITRLKNMPGVVVSDKGREGFATVETLIPNMTRAPLSDLRVRRAIAHAIDKQFLVDKLLFGQGIAATGPVSHMLAWAYNPNVEKYEHNVALANQLPVDLQHMEFAAAVDAVYIKKDFDLGFASFENGPDPDIGVKRTVVSSNIGPIPFSNGAGYRNPRVDELFTLAASELDKQKRAAYYFEAQDILVKDLPYFWLYEPNSSAAYLTGLHGMYEWSAKSNIYFAQDAWWADGGRPAQSGAKFTRWKIYVLLTFIALSAVVGAILLKRRRLRV
ncbi:MAG: ABC transporter substrate-binding protein [Acidobacteria bacterium]|nr:ABC transporter substrate-binding protein [Acidobacteriota bacterium]